MKKRWVAFIGVALSCNCILAQASWLSKITEITALNWL